MRAWARQPIFLKLVDCNADCGGRCLTSPRTTCQTTKAVLLVSFVKLSTWFKSTWYYFNFFLIILVTLQWGFPCWLIHGIRTQIWQSYWATRCLPSNWVFVFVFNSLAFVFFFLCCLCSSIYAIFSYPLFWRVKNGILQIQNEELFEQLVDKQCLSTTFSNWLKS